MSDYSHANPAQLLSQARHDGDLNALLDLYRNYVRLLARVRIGDRFARRFDASDIVQEVFLQASSAFPQFRGNTEPEFLAWLRQILANVLANQVRKHQRTKRRDIRLEDDISQRLVDASGILQTALIDTSPSPSEGFAHRERAVLLAEALEQLPDDYREVVVLRHIQQLSFPEIARQMERSLPSVKNIYPRALARLKQQLESA